MTIPRVLLALSILVLGLMMWGLHKDIHNASTDLVQQNESLKQHVSEVVSGRKVQPRQGTVLRDSRWPRRVGALLDSKQGGCTDAPNRLGDLGAVQREAGNQASSPLRQSSLRADLRLFDRLVALQDGFNFPLLSYQSVVEPHTAVRDATDRVQLV